MKVKTSKGFTMAELLIVMAIVVVLAAIAIPTFGKQIETARETADAEAIRAAFEDVYTQAYIDYTTNGSFKHHAVAVKEADRAAYTNTDKKTPTFAPIQFGAAAKAETSEGAGDGVENSVAVNVYVTPMIKLTQKTAKFSYVIPQFELGVGGNIPLKQNGDTIAESVLLTALPSTSVATANIGSNYTGLTGTTVSSADVLKTAADNYCQIAFVFQPDINGSAEGSIKLVEAYIVAVGPSSGEPATAS